MRGDYKMTVNELIDKLKSLEFKDSPVVDYEGIEISIIRRNNDDYYDVAKDSYSGEPYYVIL